MFSTEPIKTNTISNYFIFLVYSRAHVPALICPLVK